MNLFTIDIDWAPEAVIEDTLRLFQEHEVPATIFATHRSGALDAADRHLFEIGIHPNFNPLLAGGGGAAARLVDDLLAEYPEARGVRSHSMTQSTPLLDLFRSRGLLYDANLFLPYWADIHPFQIWNGLWRVPYNWEDDIHFSYGRSFESTGLTDDAAVNVLDFHPIHVYLNTDTRERYEAARPHYQTPETLVGLRNTVRAGARTLLVELLQTQRGGLTVGAFVDRALASCPS